jgi:hypothetical protein
MPEMASVSLRAMERRAGSAIVMAHKHGQFNLAGRRYSCDPGGASVRGGRFGMDEGAIDRDAMGKIAKTLAFIKGADDPVAVAMKTACDTGKPADIKKARTLFLKLKPGERKSALAMLSDD